MSEVYDATYHVVNRAFSGFCPSNIMEDALRNINLSHYGDQAVGIIQQVAAEWDRPSVKMKPELFVDGDMWCAVYGSDLQNGLAGFGKSPEEAMCAFDKKWTEKLK